MAGRGRKFHFHGAFTSKADAIRTEHRVHGFIRPTTIQGHRRFLVLTRRENPRKGHQSRPRVTVGRGVFHLRSRSPWKGAIHRVNPGYSGGMGWWLLGGLALVLLLSAKRPEVVPYTDLPSTTVWISDLMQIGGTGNFFIGSAPPGASPPWREASQYEIQQAMAEGRLVAAG